MPDGDLLYMSERPNHPQGVCTYLGRPAYVIEDGNAPVAFEQLPDSVRLHVVYELTTYYGEYFDHSEED